ncbi:hypothetical protein BDD12DRAFT_840437 [Trichophaea hybrida]|nr:hypothetical protein BDD12DRAFT_840437 [Trichophaea hybrida]
MYRRKLKPKVAPEPEFPFDLTALGLFIHPEADQLCQIEKPEEPFDYFVHGKGSSMDAHRMNERLNRRRGDAVDECLMLIAIERLKALDVHTVRLPPEADDDITIKHVLILASSSLTTAKRILLVAPDSESSALGIHSRRHICNIHVGDGSMETITHDALASGYDAVVLANPATIYWDNNTSRAVTNASWKARDLSAKSVITSAILDTREYVIPGHDSPETHIASVLSYLKGKITEAAKVDFVATGYTAYALLQCLSQNWTVWQKHVHAGVLAESGHSIDDFTDPGLREFVRKRCRNYVLHSDPLGTYLEPNLQTAVATFSSGKSDHAADVVPAINKQIFGYFSKAWELDEKAKAKAEANKGKEITEKEEEDDDEEELNPIIPIMLGNEFGSAHQEWMTALHKLNLSQEEPGWEVPGAEIVEELKKKVDEQEVIIEKWKAEAMASEKAVYVYEEK